MLPGRVAPHFTPTRFAARAKIGHDGYTFYDNLENLIECEVVNEVAACGAPRPDTTDARPRDESALGHLISL